MRTFTITVTPVNDAPVITSNGGGPTAAVTVPEATTSVADVNAADPDVPAQTLTYSIGGGADAALFAIDSATGVLSFLAAPVFLSPADADGNNVYEVSVQAFRRRPRRHAGSQRFRDPGGREPGAGDHLERRRPHGVGVGRREHDRRRRRRRDGSQPGGHAHVCDQRWRRRRAFPDRRCHGSALVHDRPGLRGAGRRERRQRLRRRRVRRATACSATRRRSRSRSPT